MEYPKFTLEKKLFQEGYQNIVSIDEAGRGALAGPLVAAAVILNQKQTSIIKSINNLKIRESKLLTENLREKLFDQLSGKLNWSLGIVSHKEIDRIGITRANILVFKRALKNFKNEVDYLLLDYVYGFKHSKPYDLIKKGDREILSVAIASILAKVSRDRIMRQYHQKFPQYFFNNHKGYGTKLHHSCLKKHGVCKIHRLSYGQVNISYQDEESTN
ncbi:ribonuclease HII [Patescibacteria group bacterium]|nr:ribonuclease HII [Patescibacteria group bacterium]